MPEGAVSREYCQYIALEGGGGVLGTAHSAPPPRGRGGGKTHISVESKSETARNNSSERRLILNTGTTAQLGAHQLII